MALVRSSHDRMIGGVCSGIADRLDLDTTLVRLLFVVSFAFPGPGLVVYLLMWALLPWDWEVDSRQVRWESSVVSPRDPTETLAA